MRGLSEPTILSVASGADLTNHEVPREGEDARARLTKRQSASSSGKRNRAHDAGRDRVHGGLLRRRGQGLLEAVGSLRRSYGPRRGGMDEDAADVLSIVAPSCRS